jgi:hypothetical protein
MKWFLVMDFSVLLAEQMVRSSNAKRFDDVVGLAEHRA